jgi:hypothetical protein
LQDPAFRNFTRFLLKVPEHTWGIDSKVAPASWGVWGNDEFREALQNDDLFSIAEESWRRQASYVNWAIEVRWPACMYS